MITVDLTHRIIHSFEARASDDPSGRMVVSHGAAPRGVLYTFLGLVLTGFPVALVMTLGSGIIAPWPYWLVEALLPFAFLIVGLVYLNRGLHDLLWVWKIVRVNDRTVEFRERRIGSLIARPLTPESVVLRMHPAWIKWPRGEWKGHVLVAQIPGRLLVLSMSRDRAKVEDFAARVGAGLGVYVSSNDDLLKAQRVLW